MLQYLRALDYHALQTAANWTSVNLWRQEIIYIAAQLLIFIFPIVLYLLWRRPEVKGDKYSARKTVIMTLMGVIIALAVKSTIAFVYLRPRPFISHADLLHLTFGGVDPQSFPSGHTLVAFTIATGLLFSGYRRLGAVLLVVAVLVGLGRIFAGVHYPTDVLGGAVIGTAISWYLHREASTLRRYLPNH